MSDFVIDIEDTWKKYKGGVYALQGVSLKVPRGHIFGLLGPNGAGKSTLVKILTSIIKPSKCSGSMLGATIGNKSALSMVGYLPEHVIFPEYLTASEVLTYVAGLSGISKSDAKIKGKELLVKVGMAEWGNKKMGTFSKGMKQRIGIAQALINDPAIVFLDEPTDGVDPKGRAEMREMLIQMREEGRTVFVNSHLLGELELICDSIAIMDKGSIITQGSIEELTRKSQRFEISYKGQIPRELKEKMQTSGAEITKNKLVFYQSSSADIQPVIDILRGSKIEITGVNDVYQSLEDLFLESIKGGGAGGSFNKLKA